MNNSELLAVILRSLYTKEPLTLSDVPKDRFLSLLSLANRQGVDALVSVALSSVLSTNDPWGDLLPFFETAAVSNRTMNSMFLNAMDDVLPMLYAAGLDPIVLKGGAFLLQDSEALTWRTLSDIDLFIPEHQLSAAVRLLSTRNYVLGRSDSSYRVDLHHHYAPLIDKRTGVFFELHTRLMKDPNRSFLCHHDVLLASQVRQRPGYSARIPRPEHRVFHAAIHTQISNWGYVLRQIDVRALFDVVHIASKSPLDWAEVLWLSRQVGAEKELLAFLWAAHSTLGMPLPYPNSKFDQARLWAAKANAESLQPENSAIRSVRIGAHYLAQLYQNPRRLGALLYLLTERRRLCDFIILNLDRLWRRRG